MESSTLCIYVGDFVPGKEKYYALKEVFCKLVVFPFDNSILLIPLLHCCTN